MNIKETTQGFSLKDKKALIVGCGGLGCNIAVHLAGAGIGTLYLCDFDTVSQSNLNRQFLYSETDIGKSKVKKAAEFLSRFAPETDIQPNELKISSPEDLEFAKNCHIIFSAVDNNSTRQILEEFCQRKSIPLVCGGIDGFYGMAYLMLPGKENSIAAFSQSDCKNSAFSVSATAGIIGSLQAATGIKYLLDEDESIAKKLFVYDETDFHTLEIK